MQRTCHTTEENTQADRQVDNALAGNIPFGGSPMNINQATEDFEKWLGEQLVAQGGLDTAVLKLKHQAMKEKGAHAFLRATFYRWAQLWLSLESDTPKVLSVGDIHVENFGTWRDAEGRLVWGVNDFDEVYELPYTSDLVRLGVSARFAIKEKNFQTSMTDACELILHGYTEAMGGKAVPFVLARSEERRVGKECRARWSQQ